MTPEAKRAYMREYMRTRKYANMRFQRNKDLASAIKLQLGCADCGYNKHPVALDFDHVGRANKEFAVCSHKGRKVSVERLLAEIEKCDVVCANCHRIRTEHRRLSQAP